MTAKKTPAKKAPAKKAAAKKAKPQSLKQLLEAAAKKADTATNPRRAANLIARALNCV